MPYQCVLSKRRNGGGHHSIGFKLSNSGNLLKLMVPSCSWKTISGWTNYSGKVTSHKMSENEMANRPSKSHFLSNSNSVKEQRITSSWPIEPRLIHLRYILKYFERSTLVQNFSKQLNINRFSTLNSSFIESERFALNLVLQAVKFNLFIMGRNSQVFLSKLNQRRSYASNTQSNDRQPSPDTLHPWFITGFTDASTKSIIYMNY